MFLAKLREILADDELTESQAISPKTWDSLEILSTIELIDKAGKRVNIADILSCDSMTHLLDMACSGHE